MCRVTLKERGIPEITASLRQSWWALRVTLDEGPRSRDQWIQAILLVKSFKLVTKAFGWGSKIPFKMRCTINCTHHELCYWKNWLHLLSAIHLGPQNHCIHIEITLSWCNKAQTYTSWICEAPCTFLSIMLQNSWLHVGWMVASLCCVMLCCTIVSRSVIRSPPSLQSLWHASQCLQLLNWWGFLTCANP
jgi:hypothetical protein